MEYVYEILHKPSGKKYIGCRYSVDADPEQLFNPNHKKPYFTSSKVVKSLIEQDGIDSFEILKIQVFENGGALEAEQNILKVVLEKEPENWLNLSANCLTHHSDIFKKRMFNKYGVEHDMELDWVKDKIKETNLKKYGVENTFLIPKAKLAIIEKYGVENVFQSEEIKLKIKETNLERYGVDNVSKSPEIIAKKKETMAKNLGEGVDFPLKNPEILEKVKKDWFEKYGVEYPNKGEETKKKMRKPKSEEAKNNMKLGFLSRPKMSCLCCHKEMYVYASGKHLNKCVN
jgi:hypothetical protein